MKNRQWSPLTEYALLLGSGAGAIVSLAAQNTIAASLPVTALVALGLLNRRRIDQSVALTQERLQSSEEKVTKEISILTDRVSTLPTPQVVASFHRAAINHSKRAVVRFSEALEETKLSLQERVDALETPDLSRLYQDIAQLQDQYTYLCSNLDSVTRQFERLSTLSRLEATEDDVSQLKTELMRLRVNLETLTADSRTSQSTLQDSIRHLDRRLRQLPSGSDPALLKGEVSALVRAVSDLVPRREFSALSEKLGLVQDTQGRLRRMVDQLQLTTATSRQNLLKTPQETKLKGLESTLENLSDNLQQVESRLDNLSAPLDITAEIRGTTATYLSSFQWQLALLEQKTQDLIQQQQSLTAPTPATVPAEQAVDPAIQWLVGLQDSQIGTSSEVDKALYRALDDATERLVVVWPWSPSMVLNDDLMGRFSALLERQCRLEVGWCHSGSRHRGRFLKSITQQWNLRTAQRQQLKSGLRRLLSLKQAYPSRFNLKVLGTEEQFLICDRAYAVIAQAAFPSGENSLSELDLRIKTRQAEVIEQLLYRFDHADSPLQSATASFNRAETRYDLQDLAGAVADFSRVLQLTPEDAVAYNNRGVVQAAQRAYPQAVQDFGQALEIDTDLSSAWCNRGWLQMHYGKFSQAVTDFSQAISSEPTLAVPYFYRGNARQKLRDISGAIVDYSQAIQHSREIAFLYCYRGLAYRHQGDVARAITDLEMAASLLHGRGDHRSLTQVTQALASLKQREIPQPLRLHLA